MNITTPDRMITKDPSLVHLQYALMSAFPLLLLPLFVALIVNIIQKPLQFSDLIASHLRWQRNSMLCFLILAFCCTQLSELWISLTLLGVTCLWFCHRVLKGWLSLTDGLAI